MIVIYCDMNTRMKLAVRRIFKKPEKDMWLPARKLRDIQSYCCAPEFGKEQLLMNGIESFSTTMTFSCIASSLE